MQVFGRTHLVGDAGGYYTAPAWARVDGVGTLRASSGVVSAKRNSLGNYTITFDRPVGNCALAATDMVFSDVREVSAESPLSNPTTAGVVVRDRNGNLVDTWFHVAAIC